MTTGNKIITIKNSDVKVDMTCSGRLIDKLAYSIGQWTEEDLITENAGYDREGHDYVIEHFDFEKAFLAYLNGAKTNPEIIDEVLLGMRAAGAKAEKIKAQYHKQKLALGAFIALKYPANFTVMLVEFKEKLLEEVGDFSDSEIMARMAPELVSELQQSENYFWENLHKEWLHGDRSSFGLLGEIKKYWSCERVEYNEKKDTITMEFEEFEMPDGDKPTLKNIKQSIVNDIENGQEHEAAKKKAEREARQIERERVAKLKEERRIEEENDRRKQLLKMTK